MSRAVLLVGIVGLGMGCRAPGDPGSASNVGTLIVDAVHNGGNQGFWLLPPLAPDPAVQGAPDPSATPVVRIDRVGPDGEVTKLVARFTTLSGPDSETVRYDDGSWKVNWHTDKFDLDPSVTYRISVRNHRRLLGFADVDVVNNGKELKNVNTNDYIGLVDGRTLPLKFRIAVDTDDDGVPDFTDNCMAVANTRQRDLDIDGVGDACEARVEDHHLSPERVLGESTRLRLEVASQPDVPIDVTVTWGDGQRTVLSKAPDGSRHALTHDYAAAGLYQVTAETCANPGGCASRALGKAQVFEAKSDRRMIALGKGDPDEDLSQAREIALSHMEELAQTRGVEDPLDFKVQRGYLDAMGGAHVHVQQRHHNVPVLGGEAIAHLRTDGTVEDLTDDTVSDVRVDTRAMFRASDAIEQARMMLGCDDCDSEAPRAALWIVRDGRNMDHLVYKVELAREDSGGASRPVAFVDANDLSLLSSYDNLQTGSGTGLYSGQISINTLLKNGTYYMEDLTRKVGTFDGRNGTSTAYRFTDADDVWNSASQKAGVDAHYGAAMVVDYLKNVQGRNGIDGNGGPGYYTSIDAVTPLVSSKVHYSVNYNNAFWNGSYMTYGDGDGTTFSPFTTLDICGHEMTHGLTERTAGLIYSGESGGLNESMSDVFGAMVERYARMGVVDSNTWKVGEQAYTPGTAGDALRYMDDPTRDGYSIDHYSKYPMQTEVHGSSGIANNAFYLLSQGGTNRTSGQMVTGISVSKAEKIWFRGLVTYMTASTNFAGARTAMLSAAADLYGATSAEYTAVASAWAAVGVGSAPTNMPPPGGNLIVNPGFEGSVNPWVIVGTGVFHQLNGSYPHSGSSYAYLGNANSISGSVYQTLEIPGNATTANLTFYLNVSSSETTTITQYDRLFVEVRNNSGTLLSTLATYSNLSKSVAGAYSLKGSYNLLPFKGQTIRIQFRATTDSSLTTIFRLDDVTINGGPTVVMPSLCNGCDEERR